MNTLWHLGWIGVILAATLLSCISGTPRELVERNDHAGLAGWYQPEALRLRAKADELRRIAEEYAKPSYQLSPKESRTDLLNHCLRFFNYYTKAAEEADALAKLHQQLHKVIP